MALHTKGSAWARLLWLWEKETLPVSTARASSRSWQSNREADRSEWRWVWTWHHSGQGYPAAQGPSSCSCSLGGTSHSVFVFPYHSWPNTRKVQLKSSLTNILLNLVAQFDINKYKVLFMSRQCINFSPGSCYNNEQTTRLTSVQGPSCHMKGHRRPTQGRERRRGSGKCAQYESDTGPRVFSSTQRKVLCFTPVPQVFEH